MKCVVWVSLGVVASLVCGCTDDPGHARFTASRAYPTVFADDVVGGVDVAVVGDVAAVSDVAVDSTPDATEDIVQDIAASTDGTTTDATTGPDIGIPPEPETVLVAHQREFRAVWVATVWNINYPSKATLTPAQHRAELSALVDTTAAAGLNAIVFQVRAEGDAFYASQHEPWSRFLTGTQGQDPGIDPLAELIALAYLRNIEVHAWLNLYRARTSRSAPVAANHLAATLPQYAYNYGDLVWFDPGVVAVQTRLLDVVSDLVMRYAVDGIHFDDYFYPYPDGPFPDDATYAAYKTAGGGLALADWRRDNVNRMVAAVHDRVHSIDPSCRFGIAPFGIYQPGQPAGITGLNQYTSLYSDPVQWMRAGKVDYIAPQLYWPSTQTQQAYEPLLRWWTEVQPGTLVLAGNYLSQLGTSASWNIAELREQLRISRAYRAGQSLGNIWYQIKPLMTNQLGVRDIFGTEFYPTPALTPPMPQATSHAVQFPALTVLGAQVTIAHSVGESARAAAVYKQVGGAWSLQVVLAAEAGPTVWTLPDSGPWAISTVKRDGAESLGVVLP